MFGTDPVQFVRNYVDLLGERRALLLLVASPESDFVMSMY